MDDNELQGRVKYNIRYQKMLYDEYEMSRIKSKKEIEIEIEIEMEEEERRSLEENRRVMREVERRRCLENDYKLEKQHAYNKREHKRLLAAAKEFIDHDENNRMREYKIYVHGYCSKMDKIDKNKEAMEHKSCQPISHHFSKKEME